MIDNEKTTNNYAIYILVFTAVAAVMLVVYALRGVYPFGQGSVLALDLNAQYVYYYEFFYDVFYNKGNIFYSFSRNLGGEMIGTYAYYLASPFSFILLLFPKEYITEAVLCMILVKVGAAAVSFALYLKISRKAGHGNIFLFSMMYALMSYIVIHTLNPMWLDGPILFPLIILAVERFVNSGRPGLLIIFLALMFMANFYIGYMVGFFTFIYFVYFYFNYGDKSALKSAGKAYVLFFSSSLVSAGIAMWLILPTYFSLKMGKFSFTEPVFTPVQRLDIFDIFSKMLPLSYDSVNVQGFPFIYSGFLAFFLLVLYFSLTDINHKIKYSSALILAFFVTIFMVSTIDIVLHGFQEPVWLNFRYSFVVSFFILILAYDAFTNLNINEPLKLVKICLVLFLALAVVGRLQYEYITVERTLWISYLLLVIYAIIIYFLKQDHAINSSSQHQVIFRNIKFSTALKFILIIVVMLELFFNAATMIDSAHNEVYYSDRNSYREYFDRLNPHIAYLSENDPGFYRTETVLRRTVNDPMALRIYGISHSSSLLNSNVIDLLYRLGLSSREHWSNYKGTTTVTDSLLGIRYILSENKINELYREIYKENDLAIYFNPHALPLAYNINREILDIELNSVDPFINQNMLLNALSGSTDLDYFKLVEIKEVFFENLVGAEHNGLVIYSSLDTTRNAHIEYILEPVGNNEIYMYLVSDYPRKANIWLEHEYLDTFFEYGSTCIMPLGSHPDKDTLSLITTPIEDDYYLNHNMFYYLDTELFLSAINKIRAYNNTEVNKITERKLQIITNTDEDNILFTTIPYDAGWRVKINGQSVNTFPVLNSLLALELKKGEQVIDLEYYPQGFFTGLIISIFSFLVLVTIMIAENKYKIKGPYQNEKTGH